jgi:hypothetical protein
MCLRVGYALVGKSPDYSDVFEVTYVLPSLPLIQVELDAG